MGAYPARPTTAPRNAPEVEAAFERVPAEMVAEIVDGELVVSPRPAARHASAATNLAADLNNPFRRGIGGPGGWVILVEPELNLGPRPDKLVPDLAGWRRARMPELPDVAAFTLAPDWVCEVLSDRTRRHDRVSKMPVYAREGVGHVWLLDPGDEVLEVYRLERERGLWMLVDAVAGSARVRVEPFEAIELDLAALWAR
jgi:Uma2 family endonuclease